MNDVGVTATGAQSSAPSQMPSHAMMYNVNESLNAFLNSAHAMQPDLQHNKQTMTSDTAMPCADCKPCSGFHSMFHPCTAFSCPVASPSSLTLHPSGDETCTATPRGGCNECWMEPCMSNVSTTPSETPSTTITEACPHPDVCTASMMAKGSETGANEICCTDAHVDHSPCTSPIHHGIVVCADDNCVVEDTVCHLEPDCDGCKDEHLQMSMANARVVPSCDPHVGQVANGCLSVCDGVLPPGVGRSTAKGKYPLHALGDQSCSGGAVQGFDMACTDAGCPTSVTDLQNIHKHFDPQQFEQHHHHTFASFDELLRCCCCSDLVLDQCCQFPEHDQSCANATAQDASKAWPSTGHAPHQHGHGKDLMAHLHAPANGSSHDALHHQPFPAHSAPSATKGAVTKSEPSNKLDMGVFNSNSFMDFLGQHASSTPSDEHHLNSVEFEKAFASICGCPPTDGLGHAKKHPCRWEHCQETFDTHAALTDHIANDHVGSGKAQYECRWIGCKREVKTFTQRQKVLRHLQTHTGDRPFECSICHKRFSEANTLAQHKRIHTREKPYVCDYPGCGKAFGVAGSLTIHKRTHTGEKPFKCSWPGCDRAFSESSNLTKHARIHTGERPFACTFLGCSKSFSRPDQLARHVKTHTKVKRHAHT